MSPYCLRIFSVRKGHTTIHLGSKRTKIIDTSKRPRIVLKCYQELGFLGRRLLTIASATNAISCVSVGANHACQRGPIIFSCNNIRLLEMKRAFRDHAGGTCTSVGKLRGSDVYFCRCCLGVPSCHMPGSYGLISSM